MSVSLRSSFVLTEDATLLFVTVTNEGSEFSLNIMILNLSHRISGSGDVTIADIELLLHESRPATQVNPIQYLMACPLTSAPIKLARSEGFTHTIRILCKDLSLFPGEDRLAAERFLRSMREKEIRTPCFVLVTDAEHPPHSVSDELPWRLSARSNDCISARVVDCPTSVLVGTLFAVRLHVKNSSSKRKRIDVICGSYGESSTQLLHEFALSG